MKYLLVSFLGIAITACNKNKNDDSWKTVETFTFGDNKRIDTIRNAAYLFVQVNRGGNIVFNYNHQMIAPPNIADGGSIQNLYFEIPLNTTRFSYTDAALANASCFFSQMCFCNDVNAKPVVVGSIHGEKKSAMIWTINLDILIPGTTTRITFQKDFTLSS